MMTEKLFVKSRLAAGRPCSEYTQWIEPGHNRDGQSKSICQCHCFVFSLQLRSSSEGDRETKKNKDVKRSAEENVSEKLKRYRT